MSQLFSVLKYGFFVGLLFPLVYWTGPIGIPTWLIPFSGLLLVQITQRVLSPGTVRFRRTTGYEWAVLTFIALLMASTLIHPWSGPKAFNKLFVYSLSFGLAIWVKRNWGHRIDVEDLIRFAFLLVVVQFGVCLLQYVTQTPIGYLGAYLGGSQEEVLEGGFARKALGIGRVLGTLGGSPNLLGRAVIVVTPFIVISNFVFAPTTTLYVGKRIALIMAFAVVLLSISRSSIGVFLGFSLVAVVGYQVKRFRLWRLFYTTRRRLASAFVTLMIFGGLLYAGLSNETVMKNISLVSEVVQYRVEALRLLEADTEPGVRTKLVRGGLEMFSEEPIVGHGYRNTLRIPYATDVNVAAREGMRVHNAYIQFLAEGGIFAFGAFAIITLTPLFHLLFTVRPRDAEAYAFLASIAAMILLMQTASSYDSAALAPIYMLMVGGAMGEIRRRKKRRPDASPH
jgi:O-antigen ligase